MKEVLLLLSTLTLACSLCNGQDNSNTLTPDLRSEVLRDTFDFVPRTNVFFSDDFSHYPVGKPPGERYVIGGGAEKITVGKADHYAWLDIYTPISGSSIKPAIDKPEQLRDSFTIEFDYAATKLPPHLEKQRKFAVFSIQNSSETARAYISVASDGGCAFEHSCLHRDAHRGKPSLATTGIKKIEDSHRWHHFCISYKSGTVKIYVDKHRLISHTDCQIFPTAFEFSGWDAYKIRNIVMANGSLESPMSDILTQDKLVTHAINFEVNKATIDLSGKRYLKTLADFLKEHADIKLEISGHTDNDGTPAANLQLSQERADAVKQQLTKLGIEAGRLTAIGYGQSKPIRPNTTLEGKRENRRVEFKKL